jgi:hypothetical protein
LPFSTHNAPLVDLVTSRLGTSEPEARTGYPVIERQARLFRYTLEKIIFFRPLLAEGPSPAHASKDAPAFLAGRSRRRWRTLTGGSRR